MSTGFIMNKEQRKIHNEKLLERIKDKDDNLTDQIPMQQRFFPPRPIIKKDQKEIDKIFKKE